MLFVYLYHGALYCDLWEVTYILQKFSTYLSFRSGMILSNDYSSLGG